MATIEGIRIRNYRVLQDVTLGKLWNTQQVKALTPMTAVIGKNGVGKSTLFDALGFLADALKSGVEEACDSRGRGGFGRKSRPNRFGSRSIIGKAAVPAPLPTNCPSTKNGGVRSFRKSASGRGARGKGTVVLSHFFTLLMAAATPGKVRIPLIFPMTMRSPPECKLRLWKRSKRENGKLSGLMT